ncbi:efflux RND transporter permease subunit [Litoribacter alkaliphilus]|uniref:Efflux RND transporter permease subunit n=1 Tax=Litoribacter ruber TaxID=702568 RepID=A0AAP2CH35_9BACT|nr:efflux RND transporter permease subunit [Litoribacter alkaliphilus]MBS9523997.1 efflux RND transporter permease subunit [Litoribacter alkaliphilus]
MDLIKASLRKPISVMVIVLSIGFFSFLTIRSMPIDIFPELGIPTIYIAQPYGGLSPEQMEGYMTSVYEQHFIYITGISSMESRSIQGMSLIKLQFHEGTNMAEAMAQVVAQVNRAGGKMPPGTIAPFVVRYDAGNVPVGQLVFSSEERSLSEIQDLAVNRVRPMFSSLPGVSSPPPVGGNQRSIVVNVDPEKIRSYKLSTEDVVEAIARGNQLVPSGSIRIEDTEFLTRPNTVVENYKELENIPIYTQSGPSVYLRDVAEVQNSADIATGYALVNGQRSVYIPVTKRADASTWTVVKNIKNALPAMREAVPEDIKVEYAFDQSGYVIKSLRNVLTEGVIASILTGVMVLLFLGDWRSGLIVVMTIPLALLTSLVFLNLAGQTINIMTLVGLALSIGVLVDEATVTIENIHRHLELGKSLPKAIIDGTREIVVPKILIVLSIQAVFVPSFFMSGVPRSMFLPLSLAVGFAMMASFILSQSFVPVLGNWLLKEDKLKNHAQKQEAGRFAKFAAHYKVKLQNLLDRSKLTIALYFSISLLGVVGLYLLIGTEIFPSVDAGQFQLRISAKEGTRIEQTERLTQQVYQEILDLTGKDNIEVSSGYVGTIPSAYPASTTYIWNNGPQVAFLTVKLREGSGIGIENLKEEIRTRLAEKHPDLKLSFEPADLVDQVMSMGSDTPLEVAVTGKNIRETRAYAEKLEKELQKISYLRDVQIAQPLDYPTFDVNIDRVMAGQLGLSAGEVGKAMISATNSSRFTRPVYWLDQGSGNAYQVQVEIPQYRMNSEDELRNIFMPNIEGFNNRLGDLASIEPTYTQGEVVRLNQQRMVSVRANIHGKAIGSIKRDVDTAIASLGEKPRGLNVLVRGQLEFLDDTLSELQTGLIIAIFVIFLMLTVNFQSFKAALSTLSTIPAVAVGSLGFLLLFGATLNIQSYMGLIMALGVSIANAILFTTFAEEERKRGKEAVVAAQSAGESRLRPILMTSISMIVGLIPLAVGGDQTAPLGIAVIGGLLFSTFTTLLIMPAVYGKIMQGASIKSVSLDPYDEKSEKYEK